jgi:hypothetical protein
VQGINIKKLQNELKNNPLADSSTPEILVDNDDNEGIIKTGNWARVKTGGYGPSYLMDTLITGATIKFMPDIKQAGSYQVYVYLPKLARSSTITKIIVFDGQQSTTHAINKKDIQVVGQTSGEWVTLGASMLPKGKQAYVQVSGDGADGAVLADAVLFVPVK